MHTCSSTQLLTWAGNVNDLLGVVNYALDDVCFAAKLGVVPAAWGDAVAYTNDWCAPKVLT